MRQFIVQDEVLRAEEVPEDGCVRAVSAREDNGGLGAEEAGDGLVQLLQKRVIAPHQPAGRSARSQVIGGLLGGRDDAGSWAMPR